MNLESGGGGRSSKNEWPKIGARTRHNTSNLQHHPSKFVHKPSMDDRRRNKEGSVTVTRRLDASEMTMTSTETETKTGGVIYWNLNEADTFRAVAEFRRAFDSSAGRGARSVGKETDWIRD